MPRSPGDDNLSAILPPSPAASLNMLTKPNGITCISMNQISAQSALNIYLAPTTGTAEIEFSLYFRLSWRRCGELRRLWGTSYGQCSTHQHFAFIYVRRRRYSSMALLNSCIELKSVCGLWETCGEVGMANFLIRCVYNCCGLLYSFHY